MPVSISPKMKIKEKHTQDAKLYPYEASPKPPTKLRAPKMRCAPPTPVCYISD